MKTGIQTKWRPEVQSQEETERWEEKQTELDLTERAVTTLILEKKKNNNKINVQTPIIAQHLPFSCLYRNIGHKLICVERARPAWAGGAPGEKNPETFSQVSRWRLMSHRLTLAWQGSFSSFSSFSFFFCCLFHGSEPERSPSLLERQPTTTTKPQFIWFWNHNLLMSFRHALISDCWIQVKMTLLQRPVSLWHITIIINIYIYKKTSGSPLRATPEKALPPPPPTTTRLRLNKITDLEWRTTEKKRRTSILQLGDIDSSRRTVSSSVCRAWYLWNRILKCLREKNHPEKTRVGQDSQHVHIYKDGWPGSHSASYQWSDGFCCPEISPPEGLMSVNQLFRNLSLVRGENIPSTHRLAQRDRTGRRKRLTPKLGSTAVCQVWVWAGGGVRTLARLEECWPVHLLSHQSRKSEILNQLSFQKLHILNSFYSNK